jgi:hypothetical protein
MRRCHHRWRIARKAAKMYMRVTHPTNDARSPSLHSTYSAAITAMQAAGNGGG